jgi:integrase
MQDGLSEKKRKPAQRRPRGRGQGEGAIYSRVEKYKKRDGTVTEIARWCAAVSLPNGNRKVLYGRTREQVAKKLTKALSDLQVGIAPTDQRETVESWLTSYIDDLETRGTTDSTVVRYRGILRNHLLHRLGKIKLAALQPQHVQSYQADLLKQGFSASSLVVHRALLSGALKQAVTFGLIARNVVSLVKPPREDKDAKGKTLTPQQARALLDAIHGDRLEAFHLLLLTAGLRRGEALGVCWDDLELDGSNGPTLHVRRQLQWPHGKATLVPLKSRKGLRSIPLPSVTVEALRARKDQQQFERALIGDENWRAGALVFNAGDGAPLHRNTIVKQFHAHIRSAGIGYLRPHDLRHTYGSLLMSQGVPLKTISELMGHASIEVTADVYLHSLDVQVRDTARSVENALAEPSTPVCGICPTCGRSLLPELTGVDGSRPIPQDVGTVDTRRVRQNE